MHRETELGGRVEERYRQRECEALCKTDERNVN
jgi:hypothetical protein